MHFAPIIVVLLSLQANTSTQKVLEAFDITQFIGFQVWGSNRLSLCITWTVFSYSLPKTKAGKAELLSKFLQMTATVSSAQSWTLMTRNRDHIYSSPISEKKNFYPDSYLQVQYPPGGFRPSGISRSVL